MADPAVISDGETYRKIAKTHSELSEIVTKYRDYKRAEAQSRRGAAMVEDPIRKCARWPTTKSRGSSRRS